MKKPSRNIFREIAPVVPIDFSGMHKSEKHNSTIFRYLKEKRRAKRGVNQTFNSGYENSLNGHLPNIRQPNINVNKSFANDGSTTKLHTRERVNKFSRFRTDLEDDSSVRIRLDNTRINKDAHESGVYHRAD